MRFAIVAMLCQVVGLGVGSGWALAQGGLVVDESRAFITKWQGEAGKPIQVPLYGRYAYRWELSDGSEVASGVAALGQGELLELPVPESGEYVLKAGPVGVRRIEFGVKDAGYGDFYFQSRGTPLALRSVLQWGVVVWESFAGAFCGCRHMNIAAGAGRPALGGVESMESAFSFCHSLDAPIGNWDVSRVISMRNTFQECTAFNGALGGWDVSRVTDMSGMFWGCSAFNQPLGGWRVGQVSNMRFMFANCIAFNQPLGGWDVSQVRNMEAMFEGCASFNQPLGGWDVSRVRGMRDMFRGCIAFNQPLGRWDLSGLVRNADWEYDFSLAESGLSVKNYSLTLEQWVKRRGHLKRGIRVDARGLRYNAAARLARQALVDGSAWRFNDDAEASVGRR